MIICNKLIFFFCVLVCFCQLALADNDTQWPESIIVITSDQRPVSKPISFPNNYDGFSPEINVLSLDAVFEMEEQLSQNLPANEAKARNLIEQRFKDIGRGQLEADIRNAYRAVGIAMKYGVNRYPAIVFDHQAVVYGLADVAAATSLYLAWLINQQGVDGNGWSS